MDKEETPSNY